MRTEPRAVLGAEGRWRQFRCRDRVRVPAASDRPAGLRRNDPASPGGRRRLARFYRDSWPPRRRGLRRFRADHRPAGRPNPRTARGQPAAALYVLYVGDPAEARGCCGRCWNGANLGQTGSTDAVHGGAGDERRRDPVGYQRILQDRLSAGAARRRHRRPGREGGRGPFTFTGVFVPSRRRAVPDRPHQMALDVPDTKWFYFCEALWWDPAAAEAEIAWAHAFKDTMRPWASTRRPRTSSLADEGQTRLRASYGDTTTGDLSPKTATTPATSSPSTPTSHRTQHRCNTDSREPPIDEPAPMRSAAPLITPTRPGWLSGMERSGVAGRIRLRKEQRHCIAAGHRGGVQDPIDPLRVDGDVVCPPAAYRLRTGIQGV